MLAEKYVAQETASVRTNELLVVTPMFRKVVNMAEVEPPEPEQKPTTVKMVVGPKKHPSPKTQVVKVPQVKKVAEKRDIQEENGDVPATKKAKTDGEEGDEGEAPEGQEGQEEESGEKKATTPVQKRVRKPTAKVKVSFSKHFMLVEILHILG